MYIRSRFRSDEMRIGFVNRSNAAVFVIEQCFFLHNNYTIDGPFDRSVRGSSFEHDPSGFATDTRTIVRVSRVEHGRRTV